MYRKMILVSLALIFVLAGMPDSASASNVANTSQKGSLLIFPKIVTAPSVDTIIYLGNDHPNAEVYVICYMVNENQGLADFRYRLYANQQIAISASNTFPPDTSGQLLCWAIDKSNTTQIRHNHLHGKALIQYTPPGSEPPISEPSAVSYSAWSYRALKDPGPAKGGTPGRLPLDGNTYDASPNYLLSNYTPGSLLVGPALPLQAELALAPTSQDLRQDRTPTCTKARFDLWNAISNKFTGAYQCVNTWFGGLLEQVGDDNSTGFGGYQFTADTLGSLPARYRVTHADPNGQCAATCSGANEASVPFVGVMLYESIFPHNTPHRVPYAAFALEGAGADTTGVILYDVETPTLPPVAVTNGPWPALPGTEITFDGTASYSPSDKEIISYEWDLDGDGLFNETNGDDGTPVNVDFSKVKKTFSTIASNPITLRVTDDEGRTGVSSAENSFVSISLVFAQGYKVAYKEIIDRYTQYQGIKVLFKNNGEAAVTNVVATLTSVPSNFTIENNVVNLGTLDASESQWSIASYDPETEIATGIRLMLDKRVTQPVGAWKWQLDFTFNGADYTIEDLPAL